MFALLWLIRPAPPSWRTYLDDHFPAMDPHKEFPALYGEPFRKIVYLHNDVVRRDEWKVQDVQELVDIQRRGYPRPSSTHGRPPEEEQIFFVFSAAGQCLSARLHAGAPIDPAARELIVQHWLGELDEQFPERRVDGGLDLLYHKFIEERPIRLAVERLLDDPDEDVRHTMALQLSRYDDSKQRSLEYEARKQAAR